MTFPDYLAWLTRANKKLFAADKIELTPAALINQLERAYQAGANHAPVSDRSLFDEIFPSFNKKGKP
jgi:hypothetical protein